jgi:hypothetical protein
MSGVTYGGIVRVESRGWWVLQDSNPQGTWTETPTSEFAGVMEEEGIYLISGVFAGDIEVAVEVHELPPIQPNGWAKSLELMAKYPSCTAVAYAQGDWPSEDLEEIRLPAQNVVVRVLVNGWRSPPGSAIGPESWLLQVWPASHA